ncbi:hypothetical protein VTL71DRAFT_209 [Oculimacula yallundae]|uniref:Uncharacterized protein n=1 Tax=Oculimacula yallundae TaxID=86028 RepID=A0ABR4CZH7_9HELO
MKSSVGGRSRAFKDSILVLGSREGCGYYTQGYEKRIECIARKERIDRTQHTLRLPLPCFFTTSIMIGANKLKQGLLQSFYSASKSCLLTDMLHLYDNRRRKPLQASMHHQHVSPRLPTHQISPSTIP